MNELIIKEISKDLNITEKQVTTVLSLLCEEVYCDRNKRKILY